MVINVVKSLTYEQPWMSYEDTTTTVQDFPAKNVEWDFSRIYNIRTHKVVHVFSLQFGLNLGMLSTMWSTKCGLERFCLYLPTGYGFHGKRRRAKTVQVRGLQFSEHVPHSIS